MYEVGQAETRGEVVADRLIGKIGGEKVASKQKHGFGLEIQKGSTDNGNPEESDGKHEGGGVRR